MVDCQATEATADLFLWLLANPMGWTGIDLQEKRGDRDERPVALAAMASDREDRVEIYPILLNARVSHGIAQTDARKATVRRFGRSDRLTLRQPDGTRSIVRRVEDRPTLTRSRWLI